MAFLLSDLTARTQAAFRARVSGDPTGAPDWVRDIARFVIGYRKVAPVLHNTGQVMNP